MKKISTLIIALFAITAFARVGIQRFDHKLSAETEVELLDKIEEAIPLIQKGKIKSVFQTTCWPNNKKTIKIKNIITRKAYKYVDEELVPYFVGKINYIHKRCRD